MGVGQRKVRDFFIEVPGGKVYLKTWTPGYAQSSIPIILLHDSLGCVEMWRSFPEQLCERFGRSVIAYDRLGFGKSDARTELPSVHFVEEEAEIYFPNILKHLELKEFDLFGHSVGGGMAVACAGHNPSACRSVVTESAQAFVEDRTKQGISKAAENFKIPENFDRLKKYHGEKAGWVLSAWVDVWLSPEFSSWSLAPQLPKVICPLLAIHGENDEYGSTKFPEMICKLSKGRSQKHILSTCGHVPHREQPEVVMGLLSDFYSGRLS